MRDSWFQRCIVAVVWCWLALFVFIPSFFLLITSFLQNGDTELVRLQLTFQHYAALFNQHYLRAFLRSFALAGSCTLGCLLLAYPFSYLLARMSERVKHLLLLLIMIPFWTSSLIRSYAIVAILKTQGILNSCLMALGIIQEPIQWMFTNTATVVGLIYTLLPLMILPLYANIEKLDARLIDAARDLGAGRRQIFLKIVLPLTMPGILAGCLLVFLPAMTLFYIPDLLGGAKTVLLGNIIQHQFLMTGDWPLGAAISVTLTVLMGLLLLIYRQYYRHPEGERHA